jgi:hypothetical protein
LSPSARPAAHLPREYRRVLTSNEKGNIAEAAITLEAIKLGIDVLKPVAEHARYDLLFDLRTRVMRVQCKWGSFGPGSRLGLCASGRFEAHAQWLRHQHVLG